MTSAERELCSNLLIIPGREEISDDEFRRRFPTALRDGVLSPDLLQDVYDKRDSEDLRCAMLVGFSFGFSDNHLKVLRLLVNADWHYEHENVVSALDQLRSPNSIDALFAATQWIPEYLKFDENRALAVKAIWAIGNLPGNESMERLQQLTSDKNSVIREAALYQLELRRQEGR